MLECRASHNKYTNKQTHTTPKSFFEIIGQSWCKTHEWWTKLLKRSSFDCCKTLYYFVNDDKYMVLFYFPVAALSFCLHHLISTQTNDEFDYRQSKGQ